MRHSHYMPLIIAVLLLGACGDKPDASTGGDARESATSTTADAAVTAVADAAPTALAGDGAMVIHVAAGGQHPDRFCMPRWGIANRTGRDVGALLVHLEWRDRNGEVLKSAGEFGSMVEPFAAGSDKDLSMDGHAVACRDLRVVVTTYACRDANAVRVACPGPLRAVASGGIEIDLGGAAEGTMKGAVEG